MTIIEEYRNRIRQADSPGQKKALAAELHHLADIFDETQKIEYEQAMSELRHTIAHQLNELDPVVQRAEAILSRYSPTAKST